ncbi:phospholipase D family protein [Arhodomonas sp. SL1]|uniref:phospholipase D family protein n=1 Tax=Arhodomonas sp. SL1 TaxID=3425691 RepID=UPI003F882618
MALGSRRRGSGTRLRTPLLLPRRRRRAVEDRTDSASLPVDEAMLTRLGRAVAERSVQHPDESGIHPLPDPFNAFAARVLLCEAAERTLDVQYYIWQGDLTGTLMLISLFRAAERGVRVRLLLDDNGIDGLDRILAAANAHPNLEVRLFNPFTLRWPKSVGYLTDFVRANRRMHNKSFTADNQATIIGGRNIGDEYFGAGEGQMFADLDVLAAGPVAQDVSEDFDRYWASASACPLEALVGWPTSADADLEAAETMVAANPVARTYLEAVQASGLIRELETGELDMHWAKTRMLSDDPAKGAGDADPEQFLTRRLEAIIADSRRTFRLVSPYFVPTRHGADLLSSLVEGGVDTRVLTNALEATDVAVVHAGYMKRRKELLRAGVRLYEMRRLSPKGDWKEMAGPLGTSGSSLHAKTFTQDGERVFVGSFNFDARSANYNTELGFVIDSAALARQIDRAFTNVVPRSAYEVQLSRKGRVVWLERVRGEPRYHETEPRVGLGRRFGIRLLSLLPIEGLL